MTGKTTSDDAARERQRPGPDNLAAVHLLGELRPVGPEPGGEDEFLRRRLLHWAADRITPTRPEWHVPEWVLSRALNTISGRQGSGKTTFAAYLVARATHGLARLDMTAGSEPTLCAVLSLEEPKDRVVARLKAAGADLEMMTVLGDVRDLDVEGRPYRRPWSLPGDVSILGEVIGEHGIGLVVVDGLGYALSGDGHSYSVVGSALAALSGEADRTGCAIVGLMHPPKGSTDPVTASVGSTAWTAIPRVCMVLGFDPGDESRERRCVRVAKSNYRIPETGFSFVIASDSELECGYVTGMAPSVVTAEQITAVAPTESERTERREARELLCGLLEEGPAGFDQVAKAADAAGFSRRTMERARRELGVVSTKRIEPATRRMTGWVLSLPVHTANPDSTPPQP